VVPLTHPRLLSADMRELHRSGWDRYLDRLTRRRPERTPVQTALTTSRLVAQSPTSECCLAFVKCLSYPCH
jgi:hypothetical protein